MGTISAGAIGMGAIGTGTIGVDTRIQALANVLLILAEFFKFPDEEFFQALHTGEVDEQIRELSMLAGYPISRSTCFQDEVASYETLVDMYNTCLLGIHQPFAPPVESVYKVWTRDVSYQGPLKDQKGYLMGDSAQHVRHILDALGLEVPQEYAMMPDHLAITLEILAYFLRQEMFDEAEQFKTDHLDWLPEFRSALSQLDGSGAYVDVVQALENILTENSMEIN